MSLKERISQYKQQSAGKASESMLATMSAATQAVHDSLSNRQIPAVGQAFPAFALPNSHGQSTNMSDILSQGPLVITFFRGMW